MKVDRSMWPLFSRGLNDSVKPRAKHRRLAGSYASAMDVTEIRTTNIRRSEEHTSELQSLMRISYAVFCLKKKKHNNLIQHKHLPTQPTYKHKYYILKQATSNSTNSKN